MEPATTKPRHHNAPRRNRESGRSDRPDRNSSRNRPRRDKDEAAPRHEKPAQVASKAQSQQTERQPRAAAATPVLESVPPPAATAAEQGSHRSGRKRGRRGGHREHREQQPAGQTADARPIGQGTSDAVAGNAETITHGSEIAEQPGIQEMNQPQASVAQIPAAQESVVAAPISVAAPIYINTATGDSDLVQIETDPAKRPAVLPVEAETGHAGPRRHPRQREVHGMENSEPLVQIETHSPR